MAHPGGRWEQTANLGRPERYEQSRGPVNPPRFSRAVKSFPPPGSPGRGGRPQVAGGARVMGVPDDGGNPRDKLDTWWVSRGVVQGSSLLAPMGVIVINRSPTSSHSESAYPCTDAAARHQGGEESAAGRHGRLLESSVATMFRRELCRFIRECSDTPVRP